MVSHALPFGANFGDDLIAEIRREYQRYRDTRSEKLPSITWCRIRPYSGPERHDWALLAFDRRYMRREDIFTIDDFSVHISAADQQRMCGRTLDLNIGHGVVDVTETI